MFSSEEKRSISSKLQQILQETANPELPEGEITFSLYVDGAKAGCCADIMNNGQVPYSFEEVAQMQARITYLKNKLAETQKDFEDYREEGV